MVRRDATGALHSLAADAVRKWQKSEAPAVSPFFACLALAMVVGGCSGAKRGCAPEEWQGQCELRSFVKVEDSEIPTPHVIYQAIYRPLKNPQNPAYTPQEVSQEFTANSHDEEALVAHIRSHQTVECHLAPVASETCVPSELALGVPEFVGSAAPAPVATGPHGCAKIERTAYAPLGAQQAGQLPQRFLFARASSQPSPDMVAVADSVSQALTARPSIECVGLIGQVAPGESVGLADQRAHAVKALLAQRGVDPARLMTISATTPMYGTGVHGEGGTTTQSQVTLKVVLESSAP